MANSDCKHENLICQDCGRPIGVSFEISAIYEPGEVVKSGAETYPVCHNGHEQNPARSPIFCTCGCVWCARYCDKETAREEGAGL